MRFLNEEIRKQFHLLSPEKQKILQEEDLHFMEKGLEIEILFIDGDDISLQIGNLSDNVILQGDES